MNLTLGIALFVFVVGMIMSGLRLTTITDHWRFEGFYAYSVTDMWWAVTGMATSFAGLVITSMLLAGAG